MLYRLIAWCVIAGSMCLILGACSGSDVTTPESAQQVTQSSDSSALSGHMLWGMWDVTFDPATEEITPTPLRTTEFTANVTRFMQPPIAPIEMISMALNPNETKISEGRIAIDITTKHPFPGVMRFRGFDVRGIIMMDGANVGQHDSGVKYKAADGFGLLNPDGYSRWWNQTEFTTYGKIFGYTEGHFATQNYTSTATVNAYKRHIPGLQPMQPWTQIDLNQRATYKAVDGVSTRRYRLQFDMTKTPPVRFKYAIDASWALPSNAYGPTYPIEAYPPEANCAEAYLVEVDEYLDIPYYVDQYVSGGNLKFRLKIGDWQATSGNNVLNQISHVWLESPTLFAGAIDVRNTMTFVSSPHPTQAIYEITLEGMHPNGVKGQQMLVTVESANPNTFAPQIEGGGAGFAYPSAPLAAYTVLDVPVTNLTPDGDYAYVYFIPDWCATMRDQCTWGPGGSGDPVKSGNQQLLKNIFTQDIEGAYNDFTHVQVWEGKFIGTSGQNSAALQATCQQLGYSFQRTYNDYFNPTGSRVVIVVGLSIPLSPPDPPFTQQEAIDMLNYIKNGGILFFMCEASQYFQINAFTQLFDWLGMLMEYGGGATPEMTDGYTYNIVKPHWMTEGVDMYHYYTVGQWITEDPFVLPVIKTEYDEKVVLLYPLPLD